MSRELNLRLGTEAVTCNLKDLYNDVADPQISSDMKICEEESININKEFAGKTDSLTPDKLHELVSRLENLAVLQGKLATFAFLNFSTQTTDQAAAAFLQKIREIMSRIEKKIVFFELEWSKVPQERAAELLNAPELEHYLHHLENIRRYAKHHLSEAEEALLLEKAPTGRSSWTNLFDKIFGHLKFGENQRTEEEVLSDLYRPEREARKKAAEEMTEGLNRNLHLLSHIFNTILADKMIDDRLRRYPGWVSSMNLYNELKDETVEVLINCVSSRYDIPQRYYEIKRKLLGLDELKDYDRYAPIPDQLSPADGNQAPADTDITWESCREKVQNAFHDFSPEIAEISELFFSRKWIHAPVMDGKRGGAFAHPCVPEVHPYIMVNYTGNLRDVSTVAHELGHGVHQHLAAGQGYFGSGTPLVLAETASVFGELLVFHSQLDTMESPAVRKAYVCQKLESIFATVFRQVAMNRFEDRIHNARRTSGELSSDEFSKHWIESQQQMFGNSVTLTDNYSIWWSYIPHFLSTPGYVYSYAFGELLVLSLYRLYLKEKETFIPKYLDLLKAGGSESPYKLLEPFGISLEDPDFWNGGLMIIEEMIKEIED